MANLVVLTNTYVTVWSRFCATLISNFKFSTKKWITDLARSVVVVDPQLIFCDSNTAGCLARLEHF